MTTFQQFREGMQSDEIEEKLKFVKQLLEVAKEMGKEETISSLIPFLNDWCPDNDDEALSNLAKEIYNLKELFTPDEMKHVIPTLKHLATTEEVVVRDAATESINKIVEIMSPEVVFECLLSVIDSLCRDEWFTPRVSCTALISKVYFKLTELMKSHDVSEQLKSLRDSYFTLCKDDTPMVRRAAARNLSSVFSVMEDEHVPLFVHQYQNFMNEDEPIKNALMSFTPILLSRVKDESDRLTIIALFKNALELPSYRVREAACQQVGAVAKVLGSDLFVKELGDAFVRILKDTNMDVLKSAVKQLTTLSEVVEKEVFVSKYIEMLPVLAAGNSTIVEEVANIVIELLSTFPDHMNALFPLLLSNTTSQVRLIILRRVDTITLTEEQVQTIVLEKQVEPLEWRVREEIARHIDCFLRDVKKEELQEKVLELYLELFKDSVSKVRETCRTSLCKVITTFGADFAFEKIISKLLEMYEQESNYLYQLNLLYAFEKVVATIPEDTRCAALLRHIQEALDKSVPNLRFIACRILANLKDVLPADVKEEMKKKMQELKADEDHDVRYYAEKGVEALSC